MASPTLLTLPASDSYPQPPASPASPNLPNVFVIPPEEEQESDPPWCAFDAADDLHTSPDLTQLGSALAPVFDRNGVEGVVMPSRAGAGGSLGEKRGRPASIVIAPRDDSFGDSIEIVRVGRGEAEPSPEKVPPSKRPKTLAARAANALRSIKNVGKPKAASPPAAKPTRKSMHVKDVFPASASSPAQDEQNAPPPQQPRRRKSIVLSQLFTAPLRNKSSFDLRTPPDVDVDASTIALPPSPSSPNLPSAPNPLLSPSSEELPPPTPRPQSASPAPRPQSLLRRMFSFTSITSPSVPGTASTPALLDPDDDDADYGRELPMLPDPDSESEPDVEVVELDVSVDMEPEPEPEVMALRHVPSVSHGSLVSRSAPTLALSFDDSAELVDGFGCLGEMRLDSLHFDSLSFDPENFNV